MILNFNWNYPTKCGDLGTVVVMVPHLKLGEKIEILQPVIGLTHRVETNLLYNMMLQKFMCVKSLKDK